MAAGESQESVGAHFGVKREAIGYIISNKDRFDETEINPARKSFKASRKHSDSDEILYFWFPNMRLNNKEISGATLIAKFQRMSTICVELLSNDAADSWVQLWCQRKKIFPKNLTERRWAALILPIGWRQPKKEL